MVTIQNLSFSYKARPVFSGLSMELSEGSVYGLLGKNGAGKTTLLKIIAGLLSPKSGSISTLGEIPTKRTPKMLGEVFFLPEEFDLPRMSITEYAKYYGVFYPNFSQKDLDRYLENLEVEANQNLHTMSFGQKKKAMIAFALACNTKLLIMDEPTNGLDIPSKSCFRRVIASIAEQDRTIIISTHQVRDLDQLIDAVVILDESSILLNASVGEITSKLCFTHLSPEEDAIYAEQTIHGRWGVKVNTEALDSPMDMEILFNATTANRAAIKEIFKR